MREHRSRCGARVTRTWAVVCTLLLAAAGAAQQVSAEPYLAVRSGLKCAQCHVNPTGGGQRNAFGNAYAQTTLAGRFITTDEDTEQWTGAVSRWLAVGGDFRGSFNGARLPGEANPPRAFEVEEAIAYVHVPVIPGVLSFNVDELVGPRGASNRQAYALIRPQERPLYVKAGRFYLPYGWRLEDDGAFIRQITGVNFANPDTGVELGLELGQWSASFAVTNGTAGAPETDDGKQLGVLAEYAAPRWRAGVSLSHNDTDLGDRQMAGVFFGLRTGPVAWLAEVDLVRDETQPGPRRDQRVALLEGNWGFGRGHNVKLTHEYFDPDDLLQEDRTRSSVVWEYFPFQFIHTRTGWRRYDGTSGVAVQNRDEWFAQLHVYF